MVEVPLDILYLIIKEVGKLPHPFSYSIDSVSLHSLCLVSRLFNEVATPVLYSCIAPSTLHGIQSLAATAQGNPKLLEFCDSLQYPQSLSRSAESAMLSAMPGLRRLVTPQRSWRSLQFLPTPSILELAFPDRSFFSAEYPQFYRNIFPNLERLATKSLPFWDMSRMAQTFRNTPQLTHIAVAALNPVHINPATAGSSYWDGVVGVILQNLRLRRVLFGLIREDVGGMDYGEYQSMVLGRLPKDREVHVVFLPYNKPNEGSGWFGDRIVDGTLWELESRDISDS
jgi:hypothetical protein